jgi:hypothetical protein
MMLSLGKPVLFAAAVAVYLLSWYLGARCCYDCRSLAVLVMLSLGKPVLFAVAVAVAIVYLLSWCCCLVGACFCCLLSFTCCLGAVYCCFCLLDTVLVIHYFFGKLTLFIAAVAVYLLPWCCLGACFCCLLSFIF